MFGQLGHAYRSTDMEWIVVEGVVRRPSRFVVAGASCFVGAGAGERVVGDARSD
jgi:hypothetical protein